MTDKFEPEIGHAIFGCPTSEYDCPNFVEAGLRSLAEEIERVEGNRSRKPYEAPTANNGGHYETDVFKMRAYYWGDCDEVAALANFECGGLEVRWYKYLGRGMSMNRHVDANEFFRMIDTCLESVRELDID